MSDKREPTNSDIMQAISLLTGRVTAIEQDIAQKLAAPPVVQTLPAPVVHTQSVDLAPVYAAVESARKIAFETQKLVLDIKGGNCRKPNA